METCIYKKGLALIVTLLSVSFLFSKVEGLALASERWTQSDWSGGVGLSSTHQYSSADNVIFSGGALTLSQAEHWFDTAWRYRKKVLFQNASGEVLTGFPALIILTESNFDFSQIQNDCRDLRIADADGTTLLPYDVELCDVPGHRITVWVKVPQIEASNTDGVYVYFGNASATDVQNSIAVWTGYDRVLKFDKPTLQDAAHRDVVGSLVNGAGAIPLTSSPAGQGLLLDGFLEYVNLSDPFSPTTLSDRSLKYDGGGLTLQTTIVIGEHEDSGGVLISKAYNAAGQYNYVLSYTPARQIFFSISGGTASRTLVREVSEPSYVFSGAGHTLAPGQRAIVTGVISENVMKIFVNGEEWASQAVTITHWPPDFPPGYSGDVNLGLAVGTLFPYGADWQGMHGYSFQGVMDDVSIIHQSRSPQWIGASAKQVLTPEQWTHFEALETPFALHGTLTSAVYCTTGDEPIWESADLHTNEAGTVQMKVRTGSTLEMTGAPNFSACRSITPLGSLATNDCVQVGDSCIQYQLSLEMTDAVPQVERISVTYQNASPSPPPPPPPTVVERVIERTVIVPAEPVVSGTMRIVETEGATRVVQREGAEDTYTVALSQAPTAPVTITLVPDAFLIISPLVLTWAPDEWAQPQTVNVRAVANTIARLNAEAVTRIQHMSDSEDPHYHNQILGTVSVMVQPDMASGGVSGGAGGAGGSGGNAADVGGPANATQQNHGGCALLQIQ